MNLNKILLFSLLPGLVLAQPNIEDGKLLYEESCINCHGDPYSSSGLDEMTNTTELFYMVRACARHFRLNWNQQDITDTTHYLNTKFFQLDK